MKRESSEGTIEEKNAYRQSETFQINSSSWTIKPAMWFYKWKSWIIASPTKQFTFRQISAQIRHTVTVTWWSVHTQRDAKSQTIGLFAPKMNWIFVRLNEKQNGWILTHISLIFKKKKLQYNTLNYVTIILIFWQP